MGDVVRYRIGLDAGSTTVKAVVLDEKGDIVFSKYLRHGSDVRATLVSMIEEMRELFGDICMTVVTSGSGAMSIASYLGVAHIQEVIAAQEAVEHIVGDVDVVIELGGEDAKMLLKKNNQEPKMNGVCAGGTGAFMDQMAILLDTDAGGLNELAKEYETIYPIASRCGVFAKTDVQPLINEGARKEDIAASILQAVVMQTIEGLSGGYPIKGKIVFLGGPLMHMSELRKRFRETLKLTEEMAICPENAHLMVAYGAAISGYDDSTVDLGNIVEKLRSMPEDDGDKKRLAALFGCDEEGYAAFKLRHAQDDVPIAGLQNYRGKAYLGVDAGSTTIKMVLISEDGRILGTWYGLNDGNLATSAGKMLRAVYAEMADGCKIAHATATGYGEQFLMTALKVDSGEVETVAHLRGANEVLPGVEFILDIGGQDMKAIKVKDGVIETILLNEACSSGCGSFLGTLALTLGLTMEEFVQMALAAENPVDLGTRCTVFMNSMVKQAQREGATVGDIAAGLAYSVVKNALYKVINIRDASELGEKIIVQGGTFLNDAVLRAFELELGRSVVRTNISGCMGAYGAALIARERSKPEDESTLLDIARLDSLVLKGKSIRCNGCTNACRLTINEFSDGKETRKLVTGNRCEKGAGSNKSNDDVPNLVRYKLEKLKSYKPLEPGLARRGTVGLPMALNMYENYAFWFTFFSQLGYRVITSDFSSKETYQAGIGSIPSDTICYPAKLSHGHIMELIDRGVDFIFFPCIKWEREEDSTARNHFSCPVVMGYPESLKLNIDELKEAGIELVNPYLPYDKQKHLAKRLYEELKRICPDLKKREVKRAVEQAWHEDTIYHEDIRKAGERALEWIRSTGGHGIVLGCRPYHIDPGVNHGIADLIASYGVAVLTEDSVAHLASLERPLRVVDQWMYHSRLYRAARFVASCEYVDLIQLVSFGCGLDAVTTGQVREILGNFGRSYTQIKIDGISSLGAARIRIRSLFAAISLKR